MSFHETPSQTARLAGMDASWAYEVLDPHEQFSDWNASWIKFKFPSPNRQFMKPMYIPIPPFSPADMSPRFQALDFSEVNFPSFLLKLPSSLQIQLAMFCREDGDFLCLNLICCCFWLQSTEWSLCWTLNFPSQECSFTWQHPSLHPPFEGKEWSSIPYQKGSLDMGIGLRAFVDVS